MNKSQMILAAIGGTAVVGALALGYFIWDATSAKADRVTALEGGVATAKGVIKKLPVKPEKAALAVYKDNCKAYDEWRVEAEKIAAQGDLAYENVTPAAFKTAIVAEARKIGDMPGCFGGKIVKPEFHFGFKDYITGGALPPGDAASLKRLQREWDDVSSVLKTIAECGGADAGIDDVKMGKAKAAEPEEEEQAQTSKKRKQKKSAKKAKVEEGEDEAAQGPAITAFTVEFKTRPSGLVKALNAFATGSRFVVVESCTFVRERDALAEALGGDANKAEQQTSGRRRRKGQATEEVKAGEVKSGVAVDPATAPLLKVSMAFSVYDFGTLEKAQAETAAESGEQAAEKTEEAK